MIFFFPPETQRYTRPKPSEHIGSSPEETKIGSICLQGDGNGKLIRFRWWCEAFFFFFTRWTLASFECTGATITHTCVISAVFAVVKRCAEWTPCRTVGWLRAADRPSASSIFTGWQRLSLTAAILRFGGLVVLAVMSRAEPGCQTSVCSDLISGLLVCAVSSPSPGWTSADPRVKPSAYSAVPTTEQPARWSLPASSNGCWLGVKHKCGTFSVPADASDFFFQ